MARFQLNTPITTTEPTVRVDGGLPAGKHRFRLEVVAASGLRSKAAEQTIQVVDPPPSRPGVANPVVIDNRPIAPTRPPRVSPSPNLRPR